MIGHGQLSKTRRRQSIGRGLRLCVDQTGQRRRDEGLNLLTVVAQESYAEFAKGLQTEMEQALDIKLGIVTADLFAGDPKPRPYVLKPVNEGSSVGVAIVTAEGNYGNPINPQSRGPWQEFDRLLREDGNLAGLDILRVAMKPYFIPETTSLDGQMRAFLKRRTPFALVVDEYGALRGLITLEDILEEIVGDITDEFDVVARNSGLKPDETGGWQVDGSMTIRDLNRAMEWQLPDDEANTIAGLVIHEAQMIPAEGQAFSFHGFRFEVLGRRENRITRLRIRPLR